MSRKKIFSHESSRRVLLFSCVLQFDIEVILKPIYPQCFTEYLKWATFSQWEIPGFLTAYINWGFFVN